MNTHTESTTPTESTPSLPEAPHKLIFKDGQCATLLASSFKFGRNGQWMNLLGADAKEGIGLFTIDNLVGVIREDEPLPSPELKTFRILLKGREEAVLVVGSRIDHSKNGNYVYVLNGTAERACFTATEVNGVVTDPAN